MRTLTRKPILVLLVNESPNLKAHALRDGSLVIGLVILIFNQYQ